MNFSAGGDRRLRRGRSLVSVVARPGLDQVLSVVKLDPVIVGGVFVARHDAAEIAERPAGVAISQRSELLRALPDDDVETWFAQSIGIHFCSPDFESPVFMLA